MASRFDLYYGDPGSGKTRSILELIREVHEQTGKVTRVYTGDGSKMMYAMSDLYDAKALHVMDFSIRELPFSTCQMLTEGWWPQDAEDPRCKLVKLTPQQVMDTGMWVFEGASVMGVYMMGDTKGGLAQRAADGETIGQDANIRIVDSPEYAFGGSSPAHYGFGQRHLEANIIRSKGLPGMVVWTAHERVDDGERGGGLKGLDKVKISEKIIGPELIGKALTSNISRHFGNTLHFTVASKRVQDGTDETSGKTRYKETTEYRIYTRDHYDPDGIVALKYRAVSRALHPKLVKDYYTSPIESPGKGLLTFYSDLEKAMKAA